MLQILANHEYMFEDKFGIDICTLLNVLLEEVS